MIFSGGGDCNWFCLTVEKLHKWPGTDAAGSLYVCGWVGLAGMGLSAPGLSWSWQRSRPVVLGRFSSLLKRMNACRPLGPLLLLKRRMHVVLPGCMVVVCVWTSSSPELWPESSKKVQKMLWFRFHRWRQCRDTKIVYLGMCISIIMG